MSDFRVIDVIIEEQIGRSSSACSEISCQVDFWFVKGEAEKITEKLDAASDSVDVKVKSSYSCQTSDP